MRIDVLWFARADQRIEHDLMKLLDDSYTVRSTIAISQYPIE